MEDSVDFFYQLDVKRFSGHKDEVNCVAFSSDFEILVTGSDDERVRVFNTITGKMVVRLKGQTAAIRCVSVSANSMYIASGSYDKTVIIYRTCDASTLHHLKGHLKSVESINFSACSKLLCSTSWDRTGVLWEVASGCMLKLFQGHSSLVQCSAFSPCGRMLATGSWDHTVRIWPLQRKAGDHIHELTAHRSNVHTVVFSCHNILATGGWDKQIFLWNPYTAEILFTLSGHEGWVQALCFSNDGYLLASSADDEMVKLWHVVDGSCLKTLEGKTDTASHCGFHPTGTLIATGSATPLVSFTKSNDHPVDETEKKPPHILLGEEILEDRLDIACKMRAQSARPSRDDINFPGLTQPLGRSIKSAGHKRKPAVVIETEDKEKLKYVTNVEKWLSNSFQRL